MHLCTAKLETKIEKIFYAFGLFINRRPWQVIIVVMLLFGLSLVGLLNFEQNNNTKTEYTPTNAPSRDELAVFEKFLQQNGTLSFARLLIKAQDGGSLTRPIESSESLDIAYTLQSELKVTKNGRNYSFSDMCEPYCDQNKPFTLVLAMFQLGLSNPTYPVMNSFGLRLYVADSVFGVKLNNATKEIESFDTAVLQYFFVVKKGYEDVVKMWENEALKLISSDRYSHLSAGLTSDNLVSEEVQNMGSTTAPYIAGSIAYMIVFVVGTSFRRERRRSKPWVALAGALIPILANISTIGFLSACGLKFQSIVVCTLFLVLAVGCDGVFVTLRAWDMSKAHSDSMEHRMAVTMMDAGPSVAITSLTNVLSFAVDIYSFTPAIQTFSIYSTVACLFCYLYQLLLFNALLAISSRREESGKQAILFWKKADPKATYFVLEELKKINAIVIHSWSRIITYLPVKIALIFVMIAYWYGAFYGLQTMKTDLSVTKIAMPDSYFVKYQKEYEEAITAMQPLAIIVQKPGNLSNADELQRAQEVVKQFESAQYSYGSESTFFWVRIYQEYLNASGESWFTYKEIPDFISQSFNSFYGAYLRINESACLDNHPDCVKEYMVTTGFTTVVNYVDMIPILVEWRAIANNYTDMAVSVYNERIQFVDQAEQLDQTLYQNVPMGIVCMIIVCVLFIPNLVSIICAISSVISVCFGVFGYLSLSGVDLDPLSLAALLMSIGFSVDYTAHISYHYYKFTVHTNPTDRLEQTFRAIGWPTIQGGLATAFAMWPVLLNPSYLSTVFLKTVVLVVFLGLMHSLVVLPALLTTLSCFNWTWPCTRCSPKKIQGGQDSPTTDSDDVKDSPKRIYLRNISNISANTSADTSANTNANTKDLELDDSPKQGYITRISFTSAKVNGNN